MIKSNELKINELIRTAKQMVNDELDLISGVRKICKLRFDVGDPDNPIFMPIRAIESETDHFPVGGIRSQWGIDSLARVDVEMKNFLSDAKVDIINSCSELIQYFEKMNPRAN